jgi:hypothetical protein
MVQYLYDKVKLKVGVRVKVVVEVVTVVDWSARKDNYFSQRLNSL